MAVTAYKFPSAFGHINSGWTDDANVYAEDASYAYTLGGPTTGIEDYYGFGFTTGDVPAGSTIDGIEVVVRFRSGSGIEHSMAVQMVKNGAKDGDLSAAQNVAGDTYEVKTYGGATDKWGTTWVATDIVDSDFGAWFDCNIVSGSGNARIDYVKIRVYYTEAPSEVSHTSTCTIGVSPVSPVTFSLTAAFLATIGLTPSCRTFLDHGTTPSGAPVEDSGWEVFTPNEDLTPAEWTDFLGSGPATYSELCDDSTGTGASCSSSGVASKFGFSAPTAASSVTYSSISVRALCGQALTGENDYGRIDISVYAGGDLVGYGSVIPAALSGGDPANATTEILALTGLDISWADMASLQISITSADTVFGTIFYVCELDAVGLWGVTPTGIEGQSIPSYDDRSTTINSKDDRTISITSK